ncbi:hypothetical protein ACS0TY_011662 [Phlomoides rotata]
MVFVRRKGAMSWDRPSYDSKSKYLIVVLHFGGEFVGMPNTLYVGGDDANPIHDDSPIQVPNGPVTRERAKKFKEVLNGLIQEVWTQENARRPIGNEELVGPKPINMFGLLKG